MAKKIILNCDGMNGGTVNMPNSHYPHDPYLNELNQTIDLRTDRKRAAHELTQEFGTAVMAGKKD